jgi:carbonic anhydrase
MCHGLVAKQAERQPFLPGQPGVQLNRQEQPVDLISTLQDRNASFVEDGFVSELKMMPSLKTLIISCLDPRVDPMDILKLRPGEAAVVRNVGGRVNPALFETLGMLRALSRSRGNDLGPGWNLVLLQHTDCGIKGCYHEAPELVAKYMGVDHADLEVLAINDPYQAVSIDIESLRGNPDISGRATVSAMVYDVATGRVDVIIPPETLRPGED